MRRIFGLIAKGSVFSLAFAGAVAMVGCSDDDSTNYPRCGNGILEQGEACDDGDGQNGDFPNACRANCSLPYCGDGVVDDGAAYNEECDDGNNVDGDGCTATCQMEGSDPVCGNGVLETGEECDDGNTTNGDGCSSECLSEFCGDGELQGDEECDDGAGNSDIVPDACRTDCTEPICGDGTADTGEECDDGNTIDGDGCTADCMFEAGVCGNGVKEDGEECDDGNTTSGDGCDASCMLEAGVCGNGVIEQGEQCDDGNNVDGDGCDSTCQREGAVCGNGLLEAGEECDDGNSVNGDGCSATCTQEGPVCGNGQLETGEECDDGNTVNGDGCSSNCTVEVVPGCGNGVVDQGEECDDGNTDGGDGCSATCMNEVCGNGVLDVGEECDDGNTDGGDGCSATCTQEEITTCQPASDISCGQTKSYDTTQAGSTNNLNGYSCSPWNESGREYAYVFTASSASNITVDLSGTTSDLDVFVIEDDGGSCEKDNCLAYGDSSAEFLATAGATYYIIVDGYNGAEGPFSLQVTCGGCGDGIVDPGEQCDDGNLQDGDGCSGECLLEECGNGFLDVGEECDDGNTTACDGCSAACSIEECGNGVMECDEECDDGNTIDGDGCSSTCTFEGGTCEGAFNITCGGEDRWNTTSFGSTDAVDYYSCVGWNETGREYAYNFVAPQTGEVTVTLSDLESGVDLDLFVVEDDNGCDSANCIAYGSLSVTFDAVQDETYFIVVDGFYGDEGSYQVNVGCGGGSCGDGVVNTGEECDDGNSQDEDGCSSSCVEEFCGDGVVQGGLGEECDDGNTEGGDGCSSTCTTEDQSCVAAIYLQCGSTDSWNNGGFGSTDNLDSYPDCTSGGTNKTGPEYTYWFHAYETGEVTVDLQMPNNEDLDLVVLEDTGSGCGTTSGCVITGATAGDENITFNATQGMDYYIIVDGYSGAEGDYDLTVDCGTNGDDNYECGNGDLEPGEQCDDGNTSSNDGCSGSCTLEDGTCNPSFTLTCGATDNWTTEYGDNKIESYGCASALVESGNEYTYSFTAESTGEVTVTMGGLDADLDVFVLLNPFGSCKPGNCIASGVSVGDESVTFDALAGETYYIVVDGYQGANGSFDIELTCQ